MLRRTPGQLFCNAASLCQRFLNSIDTGKCICALKDISTSAQTNCAADNSINNTVSNNLGYDPEKCQEENLQSEGINYGTSSNLDVDHELDPEHDRHHLNPIFKTMVPNETQDVKMVEIVPGKGPPPEPPLDCCQSGCPNCLWISYAEELKEYYHDGDERAMGAIENIENPSLKTFIKLELGYL